MTLEDACRDLDEFLAAWGDQPDFDAEPVPAESLAQADRWLYAIRGVDRRVAEVRSIASQRRAEVLRPIDEWEDREVERTSKNRPWLVRSVEMLARALYGRDPRVTKRSLPNGTLVLRHQPERWLYEDEDAFVAWAKEHRLDELVNQPDPPKPRPDKNMVKKVFKVTGRPGDDVEVKVGDEVVPGLRVVFCDRKFVIEPPEEP